MIFTEKQVIDFANYMILLNSHSIKHVSDADMRNFFGPNYDDVKIVRKEKLKKLYAK